MAEAGLQRGHELVEVRQPQDLPDLVVRVMVERILWREKRSILDLLLFILGLSRASPIMGLSSYLLSSISRYFNFCTLALYFLYQSILLLIARFESKSHSANFLNRFSRRVLMQILRRPWFELNG